MVICGNPFMRAPNPTEDLIISSNIFATTTGRAGRGCSSVLCGGICRLSSLSRQSNKIFIFWSRDEIDLVVLCTYDVRYYVSKLWIPNLQQQRRADAFH
jgi:hypothetical protein